ncbi:MAG TPA: PKD domain-containing protein [Methanocella sp.]|nr:PKD domain-containing protein [Methanocella sp.]
MKILTPIVTIVLVLAISTGTVYAYTDSCFTETPTNSTGNAVNVQFTDISTTNNGSITSWSWDFGDGSTSKTQNPSHTYTPGVYTVTLTVKNSKGDTDKEVKKDCITILTPTPAGAPPTINFTLIRGGAVPSPTNQTSSLGTNNSSINNSSINNSSLNNSSLNTTTNKVAATSEASTNGSVTATPITESTTNNTTVTTDTAAKTNTNVLSNPLVLGTFFITFLVLVIAGVGVMVLKIMGRKL